MHVRNRFLAYEQPVSLVSCFGLENEEHAIDEPRINSRMLAEVQLAVLFLREAIAIVRAVWTAQTPFHLSIDATNVCGSKPRR